MVADSDREYFRKMRILFDRSALRWQSVTNSNIVGFNKSIQSVRRTVLEGESKYPEIKTKPKNSISNDIFRSSMDKVVKLLDEIVHEIESPPNPSAINLKATDDKKKEIIRILNEIWGQYELPPMSLPRPLE